MRTPTLAVAMAGCCLLASAQEITVEKPTGPFLIRSYRSPTVPPTQLSNSDRIHSLVRAGKLYLTVQDAIAIAIENNLDLQIDRYGPLGAEWNLKRADAGGPLRGVTSGNNAVNQVTSGQGVAGSQVSAGLSNTGNGSNNGTGGAIVSQIGPVTANLDPVLQNTSLYSHLTYPQANTTQSQISALVNTRHIFNTFVQQGLITGGYVQVSANESYLQENTPTDILNPSVASVVQIYARHNLLSGFGVNVNSRFIRVAKKNITTAGETFRSQLLNVVSNVLNLYWDLVSDNEDLRAKEQALGISQKFLEDTNNEIRIGTLAKFESLRAESELSTRRQEIAIAQATVHQQENLLKTVLSRNGMGDPVIDSAEIIPLDRIQVPDKDELPPFRELVARAIAKRPDVALSNLSIETAQMSALGTENGLLPSLQAITSITSVGLAGQNKPQPDGTESDKYYQGGFGNALGQVFRRNFPSERAALIFQANLKNRIAQGDYGIDQLQLRQNELIAHRSMNQLAVDISNQMVALRQARSRYSVAANTRTLQETLLEKEQQKYTLGGSTINNLIVAQRSLAGARATEVGAAAMYSRARVSLDQVLGETLEVNHISTEDALRGRIARESKLPSTLSGPNN